MRMNVIIVICLRVSPSTILEIVRRVKKIFYKVWSTIDKYDDAKLCFMRINSRQIVSESWLSGYDDELRILGISLAFETTGLSGLPTYSFTLINSSSISSMKTREKI